ncbi:MAG: tryptophan--tRNA ligase [Verrucomicrobia bacterium]|nr:tryptophan--tRNA ligase [Verrucomicrobiota bacterium]
MDEETKITPWEVTSTAGIDYLKVIREFGCQPIDGALVSRFEKVTGMRAHPWLRRGIFFSHKDLNLVLDAYEKGQEIYLYTGRGPSSESLHLGHMVPFMFTKYLQTALDAIVVIQMTDDEKYYFKEGLALEEANRLTHLNAKDIIACGFNPQKTWIFSNLETVGGTFYRNIVKIMKHTSGNLIHGIYGLDLGNNIGQLSWPCFQAAPAFSTSFANLFGDRHVMCLVPMAIDQYPYFRMAREIAHKLDYIKPATIQSRFLPSLEQAHDKASSTGAKEVIFMNDTQEALTKKIREKAFSGGGMTKQEHIEKGANLAVDVPYHYLLYFLDDDQELERIAREYKAGRMMTSEVKKKTIEVIWNVLREHQEGRRLVTDEIVDLFMDPNRDFDHSRHPREKMAHNEEEQHLGFHFDPYFTK